MNKPKDMISEQKQFLEPKIQEGATLSDEDLMGIAAALLHVESSLSDLGSALDGDDMFWRQEGVEDMSRLRSPRQTQHGRKP